MGNSDLAPNKAFWEQAASENPYWYVSSFGDYNAARDMDGFWKSGEKILAELCALTGYSPKATDTIAEIGCGVGRLTRALSPKVGRVHAFDLSAKMLELARTHNLPNVTFYESDGKSLAPLASETCDLVIAYCVFQHLPNLEVLQSYFAEMIRVARPGATILFTTTPSDWRVRLLPILRLRAFLREKLTSSGPKGVYKREWIGIRPSVREVRALCPIPLQMSKLGGERTLFWGRR